MKNAFRLYIFLFLPLTLLMAAAPLPAAEIWVDSRNWEGPGCTLRDAVISANANTDMYGCSAVGPYQPVDYIRFSVTGTIRRTGPITASESLVIEGPGAGKLTIVNKASVAFQFNSPGNNQTFQVHDLTIAGGKDFEGGAFDLQSGDTLIINNCVLRKNRNNTGGGAIYNYQGNLFLINSVLHGNETTGDPTRGGAVYSLGGDLTVMNSVITGNRAGYGGGFYISGSTAIFSNSTISGNDAVSLGGGIYSFGTDTDLINTIVWGNMAAGSINSFYMSPGFIDATYSNIATGCTSGCFPYPGAGNKISVPRFVDPRPAADAPTVKGNYHLKVNSELIDQGTASGSVPPADMEGVPRPTGMGYDMGAYEHDGNFVDNHSFEYGPSRKPAPWKGKGLTAADKRVGSKHSHGNWSFKFTGGPGSKYLKQVIRQPGSAGDEITLTADSRAGGADPDGGAYRMGLKMVYSGDGGKKTRRKSFSRTRTGWQNKMISFTSRDQYDKLIVTLRYADQTGKVWFDNLNLRVE